MNAGLKEGLVALAMANQLVLYKREGGGCVNELLTF